MLRSSLEHAFTNNHYLVPFSVYVLPMIILLFVRESAEHDQANRVSINMINK